MVKRCKLQAVQGECGFADGRVLGVRNRGNTQRNAVFRSRFSVLYYAHLEPLKRCKLQERQGARVFPTGAYCAYVTEGTRSATKYFEADSLF